MSAPDQPTPKFTVTGQFKTTKLNAQQNAVQVWQVSFQTPQGETSYVDIPVTAYTPENVAAAIIAEIQTLDAVRSLGS